MSSVLATQQPPSNSQDPTPTKPARPKGCTAGCYLAYCLALLVLVGLPLSVLLLGGAVILQQIVWPEADLLEWTERQLVSLDSKIGTFACRNRFNQIVTTQTWIRISHWKNKHQFREWDAAWWEEQCDLRRKAELSQAQPGNKVRIPLAHRNLQGMTVGIDTILLSGQGMSNWCIGSRSLLHSLCASEHAQ